MKHIYISLPPQTKKNRKEKKQIGFFLISNLFAFENQLSMGLKAKNIDETVLQIWFKDETYYKELPGICN